MFPIHILKKGVELPSTGTYYVVARNGVFLRKETGLITALVRVDRVAFLQELTAEAALHVPKIPAALTAEIVHFFRAVHMKQKTEAGILLHFSPVEQRFLLWCPAQRASGGGLNYVASDRFPGYQLIGSVHSHSDFSAFHSCTDERDEQHFDGLHITIGNVDDPNVSIVSTVVVNNNRFTKDPMDVMDGLTLFIPPPPQAPAVTEATPVAEPAPEAFLPDEAPASPFRRALGSLASSVVDALLPQESPGGTPWFESSYLTSLAWPSGAFGGFTPGPLYGLEDPGTESFPIEWLDRVVALAPPKKQPSPPIPITELAAAAAEQGPVKA